MWRFSKFGNSHEPPPDSSCKGRTATEQFLCFLDFTVAWPFFIFILVLHNLFCMIGVVWVQISKSRIKNEEQLWKQNKEKEIHLAWIIFSSLQHNIETSFLLQSVCVSVCQYTKSWVPKDAVWGTFSNLFKLRWGSDLWIFLSALVGMAIYIASSASLDNQ